MKLPRPWAAIFALAFAPSAFAAGPGIGTTGPDVTVSMVDTLSNWGNADGFYAYSLGATACNIGDQPVNWCDAVDGCTDGVHTITQRQHPVIAQSLFRLDGQRLKQIGFSWLKHGFASSNTTEGECKIGSACLASPMGDDQLAVGCRDTYLSSQNGSRPLGKRSAVDPKTGAIAFPYPVVPAPKVYDQRIKTAAADLDPALNPDALYWAEVHYISDNDATAGNGLNNASYRPVTVAPVTFALSFSGDLVRERSAIHAWAAEDPAVSIHNADVPGDIVQRFEVARKVTQVDEDTWHYELAIRNMNADRSARSFRVDFADGTPIANAGWYGVAHHSGEPYATTPWEISVTPESGIVHWTTVSITADAYANALRWGTMSNFWFDADAAPGTELYTIGLFKPGVPSTISWTWPVFADGFEANNFAVWELSP